MRSLESEARHSLRTDPLPIPWGQMVVFLFALLWLSALAWWHRNVMMDDPWITFRYAQNLLAGHGWVFNPGEPLEGYSNFLWVLLNLLPISLDVEPFGFARLAGWASAAAMLGLLVFGLGRPGGLLHVPRSAHAAILLASCYPLAVWSIGGLETAFHTLLVTLFAFALAGLLDRPDARRAAIAGGLLLALGLSRPEGAMFAALLALVPLWHRGKGGWTGVAVAGAVFLAGYLAYTWWRLQTFGTIIPNTVSAKVGGGPISRAWEGLGYAFGYLSGPPSVLLLLAGLGIWRWWGALLRRVPGDPEAALLAAMLAVVLLQGAFAVAVGGDWMPSVRFLVPGLPALCVAAGLEVRRWIAPLRGVVLFFMLAGGVLQARAEPMLRWCRWAAKEMGGVPLVQPLAEAGAWLGRHGTPDQLLAGSEAGILPYRAEMRFVDMLGLVDGHVASLPGGLHEKYDPAYVLSREPDFIVLGWIEEADGAWPMWEADRAMAEHSGFAAAYEERARWPRPMPTAGWGMQPGYVAVYGRAEPGGP